MKSLKGRLVGVTCIVMLICLMVTAFISYSIASRAIRSESMDKYSLLTEVTSAKINAWLSEQADMVRNKANTIEINGNYGTDYLIPYLTSIVENYNTGGYIYDLYFTDTGNQMSSGTGYVPDGSTDFTQRDWFTGACEQDDLYFSTPYRDDDSGKLVITISERLMKDGQLAGVLATDIFVDTLIEIVNGQELPDNSYLFIVDSKSGIVNHPNSAFGYVDDEPISLISASGGIYGELVSYIGSNEKEPVLMKDYYGVSRSFYAQSVDCCDWYVVAAISSQVMNQSRISMLGGFLAAMVISIVVGISISFFIASRMTKPITLLSEKIASGDFSKDVPVTSRDEIGMLAEGFNGLMGKMRTLLEITVDSVENIQSFAGDLNQVSDQLVTNADKVSTEMESITGAMEVQSGSVEQGKIELDRFDEHIGAFEESYRDMEHTMEDVLGKLSESALVAKNLETSTEDSKENMRAIYEDIQELEKFSENITEIVSTISSISAQTNLLALNASIEAARAGDVGRGFTVVAEEIRVLSEQTSAATTNISELISNIRSRISQTVSSISVSMDTFENNTKNSQMVLSVFVELKDYIEGIEKINETLSSGMSVFIESKDHIDKSFEEIDDNMQTCLSSTGDAKTLSKEQADWVGSLEDQSRTLKELAGQLKESTSSFTI
ncbi:methyl-accepting chemotaxis protein [Lachnospiraceae bacterium 47-T17]